MPEFRKDPFSDRWVIFAEGRADRPHEYRAVQYQRSATRCPFCAGHETDTPPAIVAYDQNGATEPHRDWLVRVVPNKFPALSSAPIDPGMAKATSVPKHISPAGGMEIYQRLPAIGSHEVIIESPRHLASMSQLDRDQMRLILLAYRDRLQALSRSRHLRYALIFKNVGPAAGASLEHVHSQLMATPFVPMAVQAELDAAQRWYTQHTSCLFCQLLDQEQAANQRLVGQSQHFAAFCPFASRTPYETWVLPRYHVSHFELLDSNQLAELAGFLHQIIQKLESVQTHLAYNFVIHTGPFDTLAMHHYHWHIEIIPRLTTAAGFEWGTGCFINPVLPEKAAKALSV